MLGIEGNCGSIPSFCYPSGNLNEESAMNESSAEKIYLVTGVQVALDEEERMMLVGLLSDSPFGQEQQQEPLQRNVVGSFAFTKRQARFLKEHLDEFLGQS
ncbi:MAG: hypothetical protein AAGB13_01710 [Cyanobacteria bacterium P01_F01_bin.33]